VQVGQEGGDIVTHMKTTVEISDDLFERAKALARREDLTLRELIEAGLHHEIRERENREDFRLRKASFRGEGLQPEFVGADWSVIRAAAYGARGG